MQKNSDWKILMYYKTGVSRENNELTVMLYFHLNMNTNATAKVNEFGLIPICHSYRFYSF